MGLDAVVYKRLEGFAESERDSIRLVDRSTGELEYVDHKLASSDQREMLFAASVRLGNVSQIAELRTSIQMSLSPENSIILDKILCDGSHSGDSIKLGDLPAIETEIAFLQQQRQISPEVSYFLSQLTQLIEAANRESNSIIFV